jgi:hypothetical protein
MFLSGSNSVVETFGVALQVQVFVTVRDYKCSER